MALPSGRVALFYRANGLNGPISTPTINFKKIVQGANKKKNMGLKKFENQQMINQINIHISNRIDYIDYSKMIAIILVIAGHINDYNAFCKEWIYAFHMPVFFFLSGMVLKKWKGYNDLLKKIKRLLIPYLVWGLIYSGLSIRNIALICYGSHESLSRADSLTSLWFFPVLFLASIGGEFILLFAERICKKDKERMILIASIGIVFFIIGCLLPSISFGYPFGVNVAFTAIGFMLFGKCAIVFFETVQYWKMPTLVITICISLLITFAAFINIPSKGYILMAEGIYGNPLIFLVVALAGCSFVICLSILICRIPFMRLKRVLLFIGENSLAFILIHKPVISVLDKAISFVKIPDVISLLIVLVCTVVVCYFGTKIINYFIPQIVGTEKKNET